MPPCLALIFFRRRFTLRPPVVPTALASYGSILLKVDVCCFGRKPCLLRCSDVSTIREPLDKLWSLSLLVEVCLFATFSSDDIVKDLSSPWTVGPLIWLGYALERL